jgi:hypothetical protein
MKSVCSFQKNCLRIALTAVLVTFFSFQSLAQLSGAYTIDPAGDPFNPPASMNFKTFQEAVDSLISQGVGGWVTFTVADGNYNERLYITNIQGASVTNTITFQGNETDSTKVKIYYANSSSGQNYVVGISGASHITIRKMTVQATGSSYATAIQFWGTADTNKVENCKLIGISTTSTSNELSVVHSYTGISPDNIIQNNLIMNGSNGIYFDESTHTSGLQILNNKFEDQAHQGISLEYEDEVIIYNNEMYFDNPDKGSVYGIHLYRCDNDISVQNNKIYICEGGYEAIYLDDCDGTIDPGMIANNFISVSGSSQVYGIQLNNCTNQKIYHNSVNMTTTSSGASAFYGSGGSGNLVNNNIFSNTGGGYAYYSNSTTIASSDYNNYFAVGNFLANWGGNKEEDLADLKDATGNDVHSLSVNPAFTSTTDLHTTTFRLEGKGTDVGITEDIDGDPRAGTFDIGADEFTGAGTALAGTYTIGGTEGPTNFATFTKAVDSLNEVGISSSVIFNVVEGYYNDQISIWPVAGANADNTVTFQSALGDSSKVELSYDSGSDNNYVVRLYGADFITFKKMTISATNNTYSRVFVLSGNANNDSLLNCIINSDLTGTTGTAAVYSRYANLKNIVIANNKIVGAKFGIYFNSDDNTIYAEGIEIINNEISDQGNSYARGIYLRYHESPEVSDNIINDPESYYYYSIDLENCNDSLKILRNKVTSDNTYGGIRLYNCTGTSTKRGLVANNFVDIAGTDYAYGIHTYGSDYQNIYYNSVRITGTHLTRGRAFFNESNSSYIVLKNNIFSNFGGGYAFYTSGTTDIDASSDYNDYYTTGNYLAYWDGANRRELSDFQVAATPREANSISANPSFVSSTDLHATSSFIDGEGTPLAGVIDDDIDGDSRDGTTPDIGADEFTTASTPLAAGTYIIGSEPSDYLKFADAVNDLNTLGITGPVVFDVKDGTYNEQISILDINGANETNTITFQGNETDSSLVELTFSAGENYNYVVELVGTDYITFKNMTFSATGTTYSHVFYFRAGLTNVNISNCVFNGTGTATENRAIYAENAVFTDLTIQNSFISGGRTGIWLQANSSDYSTGTSILNNSFSDHYSQAIYLKYHIAPKVDSNYIYNTTGYYYWGVYLHTCSNDLSVQKNIVNSTTNDGGIALVGCLGTTSNRGLVANNFVDIGGTSYAYGIHTSSSNYQHIYNNSVRITSTNTTSGRAYYNYNGTNIDVQNNIFSNFGGGYAYYTNSTTAITASDYNDLFTTGNNIGYWDGDRTDLTAFQAASDKDANSISVNPVFVSATDMHTTSSYVDSAGTDLAPIVTDDIDGEPRDATYPDIGADEFTPTEFPLAGEYTIGGTSYDYEKFDAAVEDLNKLGIKAPVTFIVRNGTYTEQIELLEIAGASASDTIVFQSESGDSTDVTLTYDAASSGEGYIVKLTGTDYVTFKNMSLIATDNTYGTVVRLNGSVNNLNILNNIIYTSNSASSSVIFSADGNVTNNILIKQNIIAEGGTGIDMNGDNDNKSQNVQIVENTIIDQTNNGIYLEDQKELVIVGNDISTSDYSWYGIYLNDCDEDIIVKANKITNDDLARGIYLQYCNGTLVKQGLIANNFVSIQGNSYAYGIYLYNCEYQNIYYNSVNITSTYSNNGYKLAFYVTGGADIYVKNNIFANTKGGYAYYINTTTAIESSDYNDLYSTTDIAYWDAVARADLAALQAASQMDEHSISVDPMFASETDLRVAQPLLHEAATPVPDFVTDDIFGTTRDAAKPDIGAMEFYCETPDFDVSASTVCLGDSTIFTDNSTNIALGSTYYWDFNADFEYDSILYTPNTTIKHRFDAAGLHTVYFRVTQIAGCDNRDTIYVDVYPSPVLEITTLGAYCDSANGKASVNVTGGADWDDYTYYWSTGDTDTITTGLSIGTYTVVVSDENNCATTGTAIIEDRMQVTVTEINPSTCGISDGQAVVSITGGVEPYSYVWSNGETNDTNSILSPGIHYVNVIDANGCYATGSVNIGNDGTGPEITVVSLINNDCYGDELGAIDISVAGGTQPYTILWSNGATTEDIDSLAAGVYDILITDDDSCIASASFEITQPPMLSITTVITDASCAGSDGQAVAIAGGGTAPYLYSWSTGGIYQIEENLAAGIYSVIVTDANGCQTVKPAIVNNIGGPVVTINQVTGTTCSDATSGAIDISVSEGTPDYTYLWSPGGQTTQDISNLSVGVYQVAVTDAAGCIGLNSAEIKQDPPAVNPICLVTVDSVSQKNLVVWEKEYTTDVDYYNIYRETSQKDIYKLIGTRPVDSLSTFVDSVADPAIRSWKYKLSVVDVCGNESELSVPHKTMHLTQNLGLNNVINLIWDHYEGFTFNTYDIYRYSSTLGWEKLDEMASTNTSYTDQTPPSSGFFYYVVEVIKDPACNATIKAETHNSSRSNRTPQLSTSGVKEVRGNINHMAIYPNPNPGVFTLTFELKKKENVMIRIFNMQGKLVAIDRFDNFVGKYNGQIDLSKESPGIYQLQVVSESGILNKPIIIQ